MAEVVDLTDSLQDDSTSTELKLWIPMCPLAKPSVSCGPGRGGPKGWFRACIDNGVKKRMAEFKAFVSAAAAARGFQLFPRNQPVQMIVWFFLRRPTGEFVSRTRGPHRLKESAAAATMAPVKPDVDNLGKFLLDTLTGVLFEDDAQVVDLHMHKLRDNEGLCEGRVAIWVKQCPQDWQQLMPTFV